MRQYIFTHRLNRDTRHGHDKKMADIQHPETTPPPLAWNDEGQPFHPPEPAICWRARHYTGKPGRPPAVWTPRGVLHLPLDATVDDLRLAVNNKTGSYRLYPVDAQGRELSPVACIEIIPDDEEAAPSKGDRELRSAGHGNSTTNHDASMALVADIAGRFFDTYERTLVSRDANDQLMANLLTTLVTTTATIQQGTARLLGAANTTIKIANGVEALERQEAPSPTVELNAEDLAERLADVLKPASTAQSQPGKPWWMELLTSPMGMQVVQSLVSLQGMFRTQAQQRAAETRKPAPAEPQQNTASAAQSPISPKEAPQGSAAPTGQQRARRRVVWRRPGARWGRQITVKAPGARETSGAPESTASAENVADMRREDDAAAEIHETSQTGTTMNSPEPDAVIEPDNAAALLVHQAHGEESPEEGHKRQYGDQGQTAQHAEEPAQISAGQDPPGKAERDDGGSIAGDWQAYDDNDAEKEPPS